MSGLLPSGPRRKRDAPPPEYSVMLTATLCLVAFGALMVFSATSVKAVLPEGGGDSAEYLKRVAVFAVLGLIVMRVFLFPRLKKAMDQRYANIRADIEGADAVKAAARNDVAEYEKALAVVRAEAAARVDAARAKLDAERAEKLRDVNSRIASSYRSALTCSRPSMKCS